MKIHNKALTLIELLIVIGIIALLSAIAYPAYNSYVAKTKIMSLTNLVFNLMERQKIYLSQNGTWQVDLSSYLSYVTLVTGDPTYAQWSIDNPEVNMSEIIDATANPQFQISSRSGNGECNFFYAYIPLNPEKLGGGFTSGDYVEYEIGYNNSTGETAISCSLYVGGGLDLVENYFPCEYESFEALEAPTGINSCGS